MKTGILKILTDCAARLEILPPRFTQWDGGLVMISALPTGRGEDASPSAENPVGSLAAFAQKNFYREMARRLKKILALLYERAPAAVRDARVFCNSRLPEKELAVRAGLGSAGKNSLVIIPGAGSLVVLGGLFFPGRDVPAREKRPEPPRAGNSVCENCAACARACPAGAINAKGGVDTSLCVQAYTAREIPVPEPVKKAWGITLYGCRICQNACPRNTKTPPPAETDSGVLGPSVPLEKILACPDAELRKNVFRGTVLDMAFISPLALKRNAIYAAENQNAKRLLPLIAPYGQHPNPLLREAARQALARIM